MKTAEAVSVAVAVAVAVLFSVSVAGGNAFAVTRDIGLRSTIETSSEPLTTEMVWKLAPRELNPHRQRWELERQAQLEGAAPVKRSDGKYGVRAREILAKTRVFFRGPGPWYFPITDFRCEQEPDLWFATREGNYVAGRAGADSWERILDEGRTQLGTILSRLSADTPEVALLLAQAAFQAWLERRESEWETAGRTRARIAEWRSYLEAASAQGLCKGEAARKRIARLQASPPPPAEALMEPAPKDPLPLSKLLARAPARIWGGLFSIRVTVDVGGQSLIGQFLVDSGSSASVLSPTWLESQGVNPALAQLRGSTPQRVVWSGGSGIATEAAAFKISVSGLTVPMNHVLLMETELFSPPAHISTCCDGILGSDFLRLYAVEFKADDPPEVLVWPRESFHPPWTDAEWVELSSSPTGDLSSLGCATVSAGGNARKPLKIPGVRWDTGSEAGLDIHQPWEKAAIAARSSFSIRCAKGVTIAEGVTPTYPQKSGEPDGPFRSRVPGANIGMELLERGPFALDPGNGRIWFSKKSLSARGLANRSGLEVGFKETEDGSRELRVLRIEPGSAAEKLKKLGLGPERVITELDGKPADELDIWEAKRRLSGAYGDTVTIKWETPDGRREKLAQLQLAPPKPAPPKLAR